jgi:hypothetical protein
LPWYWTAVQALARCGFNSGAPLPTVIALKELSCG